VGGDSSSVCHFKADRRWVRNIFIHLVFKVIDDSVKLFVIFLLIARQRSLIGALQSVLGFLVRSSSWCAICCIFL
jgi:hypothetical protein